MQLNTKMLAMIVGLSSYGMVVSMEKGNVTNGITTNSVNNRKDGEPAKVYFLMRRTPENQAEQLAIFACVKNTTEKDRDNVLLSARWLMNQRKDITDDTEWVDFINNFVGHMNKSVDQWFGEELILDNPVGQAKLQAMIHAVKETTSELKPGENRSQLLIDRAQEAISKIDLQ